MGNNSISENERILVVVDQQNIIHIDPNSVVTNDGQITSRLVDHESLVTYVNLEADLVPRSFLYSENGTNTLVSIAEGKFNMMRNQNAKEGTPGDFDTSWTDTFVTSNNTTNVDPSAQTFGMTSLNMVIKGANAIPQVTMNFIDVRGKTLFEAAENKTDSPYAAFFHQPWPIFYLTIKGYYGKAIRYRLQMVDFKTKFNGNTGNFEITSKFVGSTYAYLNDILFQNAVNAPYMYMVETNDDFKTNPKTGLIEKKVSSSTKGYQILKAVYDEYKAKGYIPKDFPVKTLRDLLMTANTLDKILETTLFSETVDPSVLSGVAEFDSLLDNFEKKVIAWAGRYLSGTILITKNDNSYYGLNKTITDQNKTSNGANTGDIITGTTIQTSLQSIMNKFVADAAKNLAFGNKVNNSKEIKTFTIGVNNVSNASSFMTFENGNYGVAINYLVAEIKKIQMAFIKSRQEVEDKVEAKMNNIIKNPKTIGGFGFSPTIRNVFAVILANADTYIRLMRDVHVKAVRNSDKRKTITVSKEQKNEGIYPWPLVTKNSDKNTPTSFYPGDPSISKEIKGNDFTIWPEVEFVETYNSVATKRIDPLSGKELNSSQINFVFPDDADSRVVKNVSSVFKIGGIVPYTNKSYTNFIYEFYERAFYLTSFDSFNFENGLKTIYQKEFETIDSCTKDDIDLREMLSTQIRSINNLQDQLKLASPNDRYVFFRDRLPTVDYIKELVDSDFELSEYKKADTSQISDNTYVDLQTNLDSYKIEDYRLNIYPFNSDLYTTYLGKHIDNTHFNFTNILKVNEYNNFINSPVESKAWIKDGYTKNLFVNAMSFGDLSRNMLNTPYFHKQLFSDFMKGGVEERYVGSAYLLLNSLPFKDLDDTIIFNDGKDKVLMSSLFREVGSSNYVPYHLLLKWGSMYHRYKKYLLEGVDIISGVTTPIDTSKFFDNSSNTIYDFTNIDPYLSGITHSQNKIVGIYPYYHGIFHQIVNGYSFFNPSGFTVTNTSFSLLPASFVAGLIYTNTITNNINKIVTSPLKGERGLGLTSLIDNSKFSSTDERYTILPSNGCAELLNLTNDFTSVEQDSFKFVIDNRHSMINPNYGSKQFPTYKEKLISESGEFTLDGNKKKAVDLIATFSPKLLDEMEKMFIHFSSLDLTLDKPLLDTTHNYTTFQELLKEIASIPKTGIDFTDNNNVKNAISIAQTKKLIQITSNMLGDNNLKKLTIGNPKQIDNYLLYGLAGKNKYFSVNGYHSYQLTSDMTKLMELYIGESIGSPTYLSFFQVNDIELNADNIYAYREFVRIYAGWIKEEIVKNPSTFIPTKALFSQYITTNILDPHNKRFVDFLDNILKKFPTLTKANENNKITIYSGHNENKTLKLDLYQFFKSFNDKWIAGNAIGQRNLMEEFLFLDRANRDIGNDAFISLERLISLGDEKNIKVDLYSAITILIQGTNFDLRTLPAYVNFYGTNTTDKKKIMPSKNLARNLFGTFLEVDYQESSPKIILQYVGGSSKYLDMEKVSKQYKFKNDSFNISDVNNNPLLVEPKLFMDADLSKSNRVVSFEVNFGDQGNGIFKSISLDQSTYKNTTESAIAQERLARSQSGGGTYQVDTGLFDIYKTASYECDITMMGNVMLQPTMYFYLANVPMFHGTYLIIDVSHSLRGNNIETNVKGVRISNNTLPKVQDSFIASYRPLFSRILSKAIKKSQAIQKSTTTEVSYTLKNSTKINIDPGQTVGNEDINKLLVRDSGFHQGIIPYNGVKYGPSKTNEEKYIQLIQTAKDTQWLRARVVLMGGNNYTIDDKTPMQLLTGLKASPTVKKTYADIKESVYEYYSTRFDFSDKTKENLFALDTEFLNPKSGSNYILKTNINPTTGKYDGPVHIGPPQFDPKAAGTQTVTENYGIGMNPRLMMRLKLNDGDVVYFRLITPKP